MSAVDLHLHLLPGVDDGPRDEAESLEHAKRMVRSGVHEATVTPHVANKRFPVDIAAIAHRTARLQRLLDEHRVPLRLHAGGEIHPGGAATLTRTELGLVAQGPLTARWVLMEVPFAGLDDGFAEACDAIRDKGFGIVIAHPERARGVLGDRDRLDRETSLGAVLQVNVCSLAGDHGPDVRDAAQRLLPSAYLLGSDGHGRSRPRTLGEGAAFARRAGASPLRARQLVQANPRLLLRYGLPHQPTQSAAGRRSASEFSRVERERQRPFGRDAGPVLAARAAGRRLRSV